MNAMLLSILACVAYAQARAQEAAPLVITIGQSQEIIAPEGSATAGSKWIQFEVTYQNVSRKSVWVDGYSPDQVFCDLDTRSDGQDKWRSYGMGYCGTGAGRHEVGPSKSYHFRVALPEKYRGAEFRVVIDYFESPKAQVAKRAASPACKVIETKKANKTMKLTDSAMNVRCEFMLSTAESVAYLHRWA